MWLSQTRSLVQTISPSQVQIDLACLAGTIPPRNTATDYSYGDKNEMLSNAAAGLESLQSYCWNCGPHGCHSRYTSDACSNPSFEPASAAISLLDTYGLSGTMLYSYVNPVTGKADSISLLPHDMYNVPFCTAFRYDTQYFSQGTSIYFDTYPKILTSLKESEIDCGSRRILPTSMQSQEKVIQRLRREPGVNRKVIWNSSRCAVLGKILKFC